MTIDPLTPVLSETWGTTAPGRSPTYEDAGGYRGLDAALKMTPDDLIEAGQGLRPARPRRCRLPHRHEVGLHPARTDGEAALPRRQRRRVRARHLQGHAADAGGAAHPGRGRHHLRLRDPRAARVHLRAWRGAARRPPAAARGAGGLRWPATSATTSTGPATTSTSSSTPAPVPTSAVRRPRCSTRSRACAASPGCARRSRRSPGSTPSHGHQQRRDDRVGPVRRRARRRLVRLDGHREVQGPHPLLAVRPRGAARAVRGAARHHAARAARARRRRARGAPS